MQELLHSLIPNVMSKTDVLWKAVGDTLVMLLWSASIAFLVGLFTGVVIVITKQGGIAENKVIYQVLDKAVNLFRAIPFIILLTGLMPLSRLLMGTAIGVRGAIVPLIFGTVPFFTRQVESALSEVDRGLVEAAQSMGCSVWGIVFRVYLKESVGALTRGITITAINLLGLTAMAGAVGAGGLGDFAISYGHDRNQTDVTYVTILILLVIVSVIQVTGNAVVRRNKK